MTRPLTVLSVAYPFAAVGPDSVGGAEQVLWHLDRALARGGHRSLVLAQAGSKTTGRLLPTHVPEGPITDEVRYLTLRAHAHNLLQALQRHPIDIVHMHGIDFHEYLPPANSFPAIPFLVTLHLPPEWYPAQVFALGRQNVFLHCVSAAQHERCPREAVLLPPISNGVPLPPYASTLAGRGIRKRHYAVALGRICPEKNLHAAIEAAKMADMPLFIGGKVFPYAAHEAYFAGWIKPRLDEARRYVGPLGPRKKFRLLAGARALLLPTLAPETSSLVAMESLAAGTPVIAYPSGAIPTIVEHEKTGYLVCSEAEMARALQRATRINPEVCRAAARERFSVDRMTARYVELYYQLTQHSAQQSASA